MNKTAIRNFAIWARNKLIADVSYKAGLMGVTKDGIADALPQSTTDVEFYDIGTAEPYAIRGEEIKQRKGLVQIIKQKEKESDYATAYSSVIEEVAYTWFNRLIAVRFMEVNDYLPSHVRVLSSETGKLEPDLVTTPFDAELDFSDAEKQYIIQLKNDNKLDEAFKLLFIKQCNMLHPLLPRLFENISDFSEILLNVSFVNQDGVVYHLVHDIEEDDFNIDKGGQVEIIGWLYQYYISEPKDNLINAHKKYLKNDIPFVTQLFTSDWIVRFMVENSLVRFWKPYNSEIMKHEWEYYVPENNDESGYFEDGIAKRPDEIRFLDPCMGSGHILVYAFDVFMKIYECAGWTQRDAARSIVENNLYGLDIDERAAQMAYFAVMMKARQYNRRILFEDIECHFLPVVESNDFETDCLTLLPSNYRSIAQSIINNFIDAKLYGSLIHIEYSNEELIGLKDTIKSVLQKDSVSIVEVIGKKSLEKLVPLVEIAIIINQKYEIVVTNPPYMNSALMPDKLKKYVSEKYEDFKTDMFSAFFRRAVDYCSENGHVGLLMPYVWMFISSYEKMRSWLYNHGCITTLVQLEYNAFEAACVPVAAFTYCKNAKSDLGSYIKLSDFTGVENQGPRTLDAIANPNCGYRYTTHQKKYQIIPGAPVAYWVSDNVRNAYDKGKALGSIVAPRKGNSTSDNNRFLRLWFEVNEQKMNLGAVKIDKEESKEKPWYPYNKGGDYRKWYGDNAYLIDWYNDAEAIRKIKSAVIANYQYFTKPGLTWSTITSSRFSIRWFDEGFIFDNGGCCIFDLGDKRPYFLALLNSNVFSYIFGQLNPTLNSQSGEVAKFPVLESDDEEKVDELAIKNKQLSKDDWDSFETSWDFKKHPLI